jgi:hypothetical protein
VNTLVPKLVFCSILWHPSSILIFCTAKTALGIEERTAGGSVGGGGERLTAHGSRSRLTAHCSRLTAHGSRLTAHCSLLTVHNVRSWYPERGPPPTHAPTHRLWLSSCCLSAFSEGEKGRGSAGGAQGATTRLRCCWLSGDHTAPPSLSSFFWCESQAGRLSPSSLTAASILGGEGQPKLRKKRERVEKEKERGGGGGRKEK